MKEFNLANLIGNPTDTSLAIAKLIFSGVLERYPRLKILLAHAGGFLPYTWGRLDRGYRIQDSATSKISKPPGEYLKLLNFDTITHSTMALEYLVANFGADHVVLGSDYPYDMGDPEPVTSLRAARIDGASLEQIASANACKLLANRHLVRLIFIRRSHATSYFYAQEPAAGRPDGAARSDHRFGRGQSALSQRRQCAVSDQHASVHRSRRQSASGGAQRGKVCGGKESR